MYQLGMIVKKGVCFGVVCELSENRNACSVEWFQKGSELRNAWWENGELKIVQDPCKPYRKKQIVMIKTDMGDRARFFFNDELEGNLDDYLDTLSCKYDLDINIYGFDITEELREKGFFDCEFNSYNEEEEVENVVYLTVKVE